MRADMANDYSAGVKLAPDPRRIQFKEDLARPVLPASQLRDSAGFPPDFLLNTGTIDLEV